MDKKHSPLLLGLVAIVSAFIPVFPKVLTLIGCLAGIIGTSFYQITSPNDHS
ncbi:hypothetical protein [Virgibacillus salexigens]|uniref:Holin n=1 Tax=Virgibacillus kapii TaxID=1638645 RepID=A0ABQ2DET4_9BACI|nr:hypothetical protein [Virgibacillus kapii]GGJ53361.1 hypothetical protein GCM10007111_14470 [Virgibacillus kapii]